MSRLAGCILLTRMEAGEGAGLCVFLHHSLSYTIVTTRVNLRLFKSSTPNSHLFLSFFPTETMLQLISLDVSLYILGPVQLTDRKERKKEEGKAERKEGREEEVIGQMNG